MMATPSIRDVTEALLEFWAYLSGIPQTSFLIGGKVAPSPHVISVQSNENDFTKKREPPPKEEEKKAVENEDEKEGFAYIIKSFAENTTAHGFAQIIIAGNLVTRLFWIIVMIGGFIILCIQIQPIFQKFLDKPRATNVQIVTDRRPVLPVIIVCNENLIKKIGN